MSLDSQKRHSGGADTRINVFVYSSLLILNWKALVETLRFTVKMMMEFNYRPKAIATEQVMKAIGVLGLSTSL